MQLFQSIFKILIFPFYALCGGTGLMLLKIALDSRNEDSQLINIIFKFILGFAFYGISFLFWIYILSR